MRKHQKTLFFVLSAESSDLHEFKVTLTMLRNWTKYILNSFECPYSNGYTEGTNNAMKVIKRNAFGYRNRKRGKLSFPTPDWVVLLHQLYFIKLCNNFIRRWCGHL